MITIFFHCKIFDDFRQNVHWMTWNTMDFVNLVFYRRESNACNLLMSKQLRGKFQVVPWFLAIILALSCLKQLPKSKIVKPIRSWQIGPSLILKSCLNKGNLKQI